MPEPMVREDIEGGRLVPLDMPELKKDPFDCMRSTRRIRRRARQAPGSYPGSKPRRQGRLNPLINQPSARRRTIGEARLQDEGADGDGSDHCARPARCGASKPCSARRRL
jgi:hypothetical protein